MANRAVSFSDSTARIVSSSRVWIPLQARWELENDIQSINDPDALYTFDANSQKAFADAKPWSKEPQYFQRCVC